jgi:hypothetical protein
VRKVTLRCKDSHSGGVYGFYSFTAGVLEPPVRAAQVDLVYYFDADDCSQGAIIGGDEEPGHLFPIGHKSLDELMALEGPSKNAESVAAIAPLTKDKEGLAFWVKSRAGVYVPVRIAAVRPTSHADLTNGAAAAIDLEWRQPPIRLGK